MLLSLCPIVAMAEDAPTTRVSFDLHDVKLRGFLESVSRKYDINMVISSEVTGRVSATLNNVPNFDAIDSIISSRG